MTQKQHARLALLRPRIDWQRRVLRVTMADDDTGDALEVGLDDWPAHLEDCVVCGDTAPTRPYAAPAMAAWCERAVGLPCRLARAVAPSEARARRTKDGARGGADVAAAAAPIAFANESPFLLVSDASYRDVERRHAEQPADAADVPTIYRFRPNFIVSSSPSVAPFAEDAWTRVRIGPHEFHVQGPCPRCAMVNIDPDSASTRSSLFKTLALFRRHNGRPITFGVFVRTATALPATVSVGDVVVAE